MTEQISASISAANAAVPPSSLLRTATFFPLGFPMEIATNSDEVLEAAAESWAIFPQTSNDPPVRLEVQVQENNAPLPLPPKFQWRGHLMSIVSDAANVALCDFRSNCALLWITAPVAANRGFLRFYFLDSAVLTLIQQRHLAPVHGGLIARNGRGVLLCGESGAGKSTLVYACARAGWTLIADDGTLLVREHAARYAIGNFRAIRLRDGARRFFPELAGRLSTVRPNGKRGMELFTSELPVSVASGCAIDHMVFLNRRGAGPARLDPHPRDRALAWCEQFANVGEPHVRAAMLRTYQRLAGAGIWELTYRELDSAIACLDELVR